MPGSKSSGSRSGKVRGGRPRRRSWNRSKQASAQAAAGQTFRAELPFFMADGSERVADVTIQPIRDDTGRVLFLAPTGVDITDRKRAEADREKFVTLIENSTDFIGICDLQGVPFFVNRAGLEMVGLDDIEHARRMPVASFFFPDDQDRIMQEFFPSVLEQGHGEIEVRFRHFKTGRRALDGLQGADVTGRRRTADRVCDRQPGCDRTKATGRQPRGGWRRICREADRRKNEFLAMLAHELRNPLAPISNAARALRLGGRDGEGAPLRVRHARAPSRADGPPGGRPARHEPHHARQDRACARNASNWRRSSIRPSKPFVRCTGT